MKKKNERGRGAEARPSPSPTSASDSAEILELKEKYDALKECLKCSQCLDLLKADSKVLPCLHSVCASCVEECAQKCPVCRKQFKLDDGGLKENTFFRHKKRVLEEMQNVMSLLNGTSSSSSSVIPCDLCKKEKRNDAQFKCIFCKNMCGKCSQRHNINNPSHPVVDVSFIDISVPVPFDPHPLCTTKGHENNRRDHHCLNCDVSICYMCVIDGVHEDHETAYFPEVALVKKLRIKNEIAGVKARLPDIVQTIDDIDSIMRIITQTTEQQIGGIREMFNTLIASLQRRMNELIYDIQEKTRVKIERISQQRERLDLDMKDLKNSVSLSSMIVYEASDDHVQQLYDQVMSHLIDLEKEERFTDPPVELKRLELSVPNPLDLSVFLNTTTIIEVVEREAPVKVPREPKVRVDFVSDFSRRSKPKTCRKLTDIPSLDPDHEPQIVADPVPEPVVESSAPAPEPQIVADPVPEPAAAAAAAPIVEPQVVSDPVPEPVVEASALAPEPQIVADPVPEPVVEAPAPVAVELVVEAPAPEPQIVAEPVVEPVVEAPEPVVEATAPAHEPQVAAEPVVESAPESVVVEPVPQPPEGAPQESEAPAVA